MSGRVPPSSRAGKAQRVKSRSAEIRRAAGLYQRFSGHEAEEVGRVNIAPPPRTLVAVGELDGVLYTTVRDGKVEKYIHKFASKDKPVLAVSPDGKRMFVVGGRFTFTERGIVDASDKSR
jgi:hypothetical protein